MIESIIVWTIIVVSAFFVGRKFWRGWRAAISKKGTISCGCGCSCDSGSSCPPMSNGTEQEHSKVVEEKLTKRH